MKYLLTYFSFFIFHFLFAQDPFYKDDWNRVDAYAKKNLLRSAINKTDSIYRKAKKAHNTPEVVKSLIYMMNYESGISDSATEKWIYRLQAEIKSSVSPEKQLLSSLLAQMYWNYYLRNRYRFYNRTQTVNFKNDDISTWDVNKIVEATILNYKASLKNADSLEKIDISKFDVILVKGNSRSLRPTLYDFLAHRALNFFESSEPEVTRPAVQFSLNDSIYLDDYTKFISLKIETADTLSLKFYAVKLLQSLLAFRSSPDNRTDVAALLDVDLERINFIYSLAANLPDKDSIYIRLLRKMRDKFISNPASTEIDYEIANFYNSGSTWSVPSPNRTRWYKIKALKLCEDAIKRFPESYGANECKQLEFTIKEKSATFTMPQVNIPGKPFITLLQFQNISKAWIRIIKVNADRFASEYGYDYYNKLPKEWSQITPVKEWSVDLPEESDYQSHAAEIKMPALSPGYYMVLVSPNEKFTCDKNMVAYRACWASNISYISRSYPDGTKEFTVIDRTDGKPIKGAKVQILYNNEYDYSAHHYKSVKGPVFMTDADGNFVLHPRKDHYDNLKLDITNGNDRFLDFSTNYIYDERNYLNKAMRRVTYFFTDRAIYRPGQTVYFKGILLRTDCDKTYLDSNASTEVVLYDVNYQKITSLSLVSDAFGSVSGTFVLPMGLLNGSMRIYDGRGTKYIQVEDYKRPKFFVTLDTVKGNFKLGETVNITGFAKGYNGTSIDGATVKYRVERKEDIPGWYGYFYWYRSMSQSATEIANGTIITNDTGGIAFNFKALADANESKEYNPSFIFTVYVDVTDANGETHSTQTEIKIGYTAITLDVQIPQRVDKTASDSFKIEAENMEGSKVNAAGTIVIYKLKEPSVIYRGRLWNAPDTFIYSKKQWDTLFPNDPHGNEDEMGNYPKGEKVFEQNFNTEHATFKIKNLYGWQQGNYLMEAHTKDVYGQDVKDLKYFVVYSAKESANPTNTPDDFSIIKNQCEPGEEAKFLIGSAYDNVSVLYEIERKNKITHHEWLTLNHEQRMLEILVGDSDRGGFGVHFVFVKNNRLYTHDASVSVNWSNKNLTLKFESFRDKLLPGQKEEWKIKIKDSQHPKANAQMMATLYDASLDAFASNSWLMDIYPTYGAMLTWTDPQIFGMFEAWACSDDWNVYKGETGVHTYDQLISEGNYYTNYTYSWGGSGRASYKYRAVTRGGVFNAAFEETATGKETDNLKADESMVTTAAAPAAMATGQTAMLDSESGEKKAMHENSRDDRGGDGFYNKNAKGEDNDIPNLSNITARSNFNETAFFYPTLQTDDSGNVVIDFTVPEATTKWKMMGMAHSKDLKIGYLQNTLITQKDLMVTPNAPRFLRESDTITFTSKITDLSDSNLAGNVQLFLYDALDMKDITALFSVQQMQQTFSVRKGQSTVISWQLIIPKGIDAVTYKVVAQAGNYTDGEQNTLPVLMNSMLVTESIPLSVVGKQNRSFTFDKLLNQNNHSTTLRNHKITLEFTANPAWYAIQALPYIMEYPYECAEQTFDRFYANSIATNIVNSSPRIKAVFESWKSRSPEAFLSNLEKNQELKSLMLEETPWVLEAKDESERKKRVGLLFDLTRMSNEEDAALRKLEKKQSSNGGWAWFPGMGEDPYITQYIVTGFGHLDHLGIKNIRKDEKIWTMVNKAVQYIDAKINDDYYWLLKYDAKHIDENHLGYDAIQYLYARSYFKDIPIATSNQKAFDYYKGQAQKYWEKEGNNYMQGMIALALSRLEAPQPPKGGQRSVALQIMAAIKEKATSKVDMGMYWAGDEDGYYWYNSGIEEHALMIEAFDEVSHDDKSVEALKVWLLRSKQTTDWGTTTATAAACYSLLLKGSNILSREPRIEINVGEKKIKMGQSGDSVEHGEAGTGYFKTAWTGSDIQPEMGNITVSKADSGLSYGAVYWQYFEQLDKITPHKTPLNINKKLFVERVTSSGVVMEPITTSTQLHPGDKVKVRIELRVDRDMDYVQMKDMRGACMEPTDVISEYRYQDGLGYYQSTRDAATNFFFDHLHKGAYVFEYAMFVTNKGNFSNGITTIQCMYAPEFNSHSEGVRVKVE